MLPERRIRILIIDDDLADREIYKRCLALSAAWRFESSEADSAAAGLAACNSWRPDCILLDYNLPDQDGLEVLSRLRDSPTEVPCAVVMLTAFGGEELAVRAMKAGADDYLPKGRVAAETLPHTIVNAVERRMMQSKIDAQRSDLQESVRRHQMLLEAIPQMVWTAAADGQVEYANRRWFEYTGLHLPNAANLGWNQILHVEDRERSFKAWREAGEASSIFEIDHRLRRAADGIYRWHLVRAAPLRNPATREIVTWFGTCTYIEDQKQMEAETLQRQKLESIGRLAGAVAHDFNTLLVAILGGASLAKDSLPAQHPSQKLLEEVLQAGERAAQLTRQMLAYAGKSNFFVEPVDIRRLVRETCDRLRRALPTNQRFEIWSGADLPSVETDLEQMRQVVTDLVMNATEAMGTAGGTVVVVTEAVDIDEEATAYGFGPAAATGRYVALEVRDTGCGMDEETQKKIFDPFFTTKSAGRGMGLAAVQGFVRSNRGGIRIDSAPGQGTRVRIVLPAAVERCGQTYAAS